MRILFFIMFLGLVNIINAQEPIAQAPQDTTSLSWGQRLSAGASLGILSGGVGVALRYWGDTWGMQVSGFPMIDYDIKEKDTDGFWMAGIQYMQPLSKWRRGKHERGGYVQSVAYPFTGLSVGKFDSQFNTAVGGGMGLETRWRTFRFASAIGVAYVSYNKVHSPMEWMILPSLDLSIQVGI